MKSYLPRSWISSKLVPGESKIHGNGVIAAEPIRKGEKLMEFGGEIISPADFETDVYRMRSIWAGGRGSIWHCARTIPCRAWTRI